MGKWLASITRGETELPVTPKLSYLHILSLYMHRVLVAGLLMLAIGRPRFRKSTGFVQNWRVGTGAKPAV